MKRKRVATTTTTNNNDDDECSNNNDVDDDDYDYNNYDNYDYSDDYDDDDDDEEDNNNNNLTEVDIISGLENGWNDHLKVSYSYDLEDENKDRIQKLKLIWEPKEEEEEEGVQRRNTHSYYFDWDPPLYPPAEFNNVLWSSLKHIQELKLEGYPNGLLTPQLPSSRHHHRLPYDNNSNDDNYNADDNNSNTNTTNNNGDDHGDEDEDDDNTNTMTEAAVAIMRETPPISIGQLAATLKKLTLDYCGRQEYGFCLPPDIGMLTNLESLNLYNIELQSLPPEIGCLQSLRFLTINRCEILEEVPKEIGNIKKLVYLSIGECSILKQLPVEINNLCNSFRSLSVSKNNNLLPTGFTFDIRHFTNLKILFLDLDDCLRGGPDMLMLQSLPSTLEQLGFYDFTSSDLSILKQLPRTAPATTTATTIASTESLSLFSLMPKNIRKLEIHESSNTSILVNKTNQDVIHDLLKQFPRLLFVIRPKAYREIRGLYDDDDDDDSENKAPRYLFTKQSMYLNFFNYCGRILVEDNGDTTASFFARTSSSSSSSKRKKPLLLPLSMWPIVLAQVTPRVTRKNMICCFDHKGKNIITASIIFSLLRGPALMEHLTTTTVNPYEPTTSWETKYIKMLRAYYAINGLNNIIHK